MATGLGSVSSAAPSASVELARGLAKGGGVEKGLPTAKDVAKKIGNKAISNVQTSTQVSLSETAKGLSAQKILPSSESKATGLDPKAEAALRAYTS